MIFSALDGFRPDGFRVWVLPSVLLGSKGAQRSDCEKEGALRQQRDPLHRLRRFAHGAQRLLRPLTMVPSLKVLCQDLQGFLEVYGAEYPLLTISCPVKHTC